MSVSSTSCLSALFCFRLCQHVVVNPGGRPGDEAIADPSTVERKVRQQVEQRRKDPTHGRASQVSSGCAAPGPPTGLSRRRPSIGDDPRTTVDGRRSTTDKRRPMTATTAATSGDGRLPDRQPPDLDRPADSGTPTAWPTPTPTSRPTAWCVDMPWFDAAQAHGARLWRSAPGTGAHVPSSRLDGWSQRAHEVGMLRWLPLGGVEPDILHTWLRRVSSQGAATPSGARPCAANCTEMQTRLASALTWRTDFPGDSGAKPFKGTRIPRSTSMAAQDPGPQVVGSPRKALCEQSASKNSTCGNWSRQAHDSFVMFSPLAPDTSRRGA